MKMKLENRSESLQFTGTQVFTNTTSCAHTLNIEVVVVSFDYKWTILIVRVV